jgi:AcrR family transcriptional regulator
MMAHGEAPHLSPKRLPRRARAIGRPKEKRSVGKDALIEKTAELLRKLPPEKLSLTSAAKHAGVHLTLLKYYFQDRTRLLVEVGRYLTFELGERIRTSELDKPSARDRLRIRIDAMVDFYFINPYYHRLMLEIVATEKDILAGEVIGIWMSKTMDIYRDIFGAGVTEGTLRPLDEFFTFLAIMGLCEQFHCSLQLFDKARPTPEGTTETAAARYKAFLHDFIFNGIAVKPELSGLRLPGGNSTR